MYVIFLLHILLHLDATRALIAYDCGSTNTNITALSLRNVGECLPPVNEPTVKDVYLQLLQLREYSNVHVTQCKVEIDRTIYYCGMHSHVSIVANGRMDYVMEISSDTCLKMHLTKAFAFGMKDLITGLQANSSVSKSITIAGSLTNDGKCEGISYSDPYGSWDNVIVQAIIRITLRDYYAATKPDSDKILLNSGTQCQLSDGTCMDLEGGNTFWAPIPHSHCKFNNYDVLFEGKAQRIYDNATEQTEVYAITTQDITFALTKRGEVRLCNYVISRTEHPKLFVLETRPGESFAQRKPLTVSNLDIFTYVNTKFVYLEKHIRNQMKTLYKDIITQQCKIEREMLENALILSKLMPEDFAYQITKSPGHMAVVAGEVVHIIKCVPVTVKRRESTKCFQQLPVSRGNVSMFMTPKTHILLKTGTQIDCNPYVPTMYQLDGIWYKITPRATSSLPPNELQPSTKPSWEYINPASLATSGIYSIEELNNLRDHIMFPVERPAVLNTIARSMTGQSAERQGISFVNLLDEAALEEIAASTWTRLWGWFTGFGTFSAGMLGIWLSIKLIKFIIDTLLHGYALHKAYGWSLHIIGAIWDSVTNVLLHLKDEPQRDRNKQDKFTSTEETEAPVPTAPAVYPSLPADKGTEIKLDPQTQQVYFTRVE